MTPRTKNNNIILAFCWAVAKHARESARDRARDKCGACVDVDLVDPEFFNFCNFTHLFFRFRSVNFSHFLHENLN